MTILTEKYRFIRDDVFLCPHVDTETGEQWVEIQKINLETGEIEFKDFIDCIHAAITDISPDQFNKIQDDHEIQEKLLKKTLFIRSSENLREINLIPEEKFKALKSWAAGIAELGMSALQVQSEIEYSANLAYPMIGILSRFMTKVDPKFITQYLSKIERECQFEGVNHKSSLIANLLPILLTIIGSEYEEPEVQEIVPEYRKILSAIIAMNPPLELFVKNPRFIHFLKDFPDYLNKLNLLDTMDSVMYWDLSNIYPSLPKKLLDEARKKCTKNDILNQECFSKILKNMVDWINYSYEEDFGFSKIYKDMVDWGNGNFYETNDYGNLNEINYGNLNENLNEINVDENELQIIYLFLSKYPSDSSLKNFSPLFEQVLKFLLEQDNKENTDLITLLLISENIDLFNKIPKHILKKSPDLDLAKSYLTKVNEMYKHNEELLIKKYSQFLNLLIVDGKDHRGFGQIEGPEHTIYDNKQDVYYYCDYREIINLLLEFRPPPKLFNQNRLFLKFLMLPEALEIQKYNDFIKSLKTIPKFTEMGESEKINWELRNAIKTGWNDEKSQNS